MTQWVKCSKCGRTDRTVPARVQFEDGVGHVERPHHTGTSTKMRCEDCADSKAIPHLRGKATMCRDCCPTGHGTHQDYDYDPTPWCSTCGARRSEDCHCGPLAAND
jgi:hypothetical protein